MSAQLVERAAPALLLSALSLTAITTQAAPDPVLEEILVTANYRDTRLGDIPRSVSIINSETITGRAARHLEDVLNTAPNVSFSAGSSRARFVQVRGIGDLELFYDPKYYPSVGMTLDDLELGDSANAGMLFDVDQVEVLRGPQGTRYGASAYAGMVNIVSNAPTDSFEGELSAGAGNYDSYDAGLVLSGPLTNTLRGRLAVQQNLGDGYIDNQHLDKDNTNDFDEFTGRARLQWAPSDRAQYELGFLYFDADNGHDAWSLDNDRDTWSDQPGDDTQETYGLSLAGDWELGSGLSLETVLSYLDMDLSQSYDVDWVSGEFCQIYLCSDGHDTAREIFDRDRERWVADIRLLGGDESLEAGSGRYVIGLYANEGSEDFDYAYPSVWYGDFESHSEYETHRYAIYAEYEYGLTDRLTLVTGARLERFEDDYRDSNGFETDGDDDLWNAEVSLRYDLEDDSMVYTTVSRGAKPGGVNTSATANQPFMSPPFQEFTQGKLSFDDESMISTEVGIRTEQFDRRLSLSAALFYTQRDSAQLENWMWDDASGLWVSFLDSTSDVDSYGLELESVFTVNEYIELFANLGLLDTEVDAIDAFDLDAFDFVTRDNRDQAKSPEYQYNVGARFTLNDHLSGRIEMEGQDDTYYGYYHNGQLDSYDLLNASLDWHWDNIGITLWGRNLTDEDYAVHGLYFGNDPRDNYGAWANTVYEQLGEPRTYGVSVRYGF